MKLKINNVPRHSGIIDVKTDANGLILDKFWRNRLRDSKIDNCVEVLKANTPKLKKDNSK